MAFLSRGSSVSLISKTHPIYIVSRGPPEPVNLDYQPAPYMLEGNNEEIWSLQGVPGPLDTKITGYIRTVSSALGRFEIVHS